MKHPNRLRILTALLLAPTLTTEVSHAGQCLSDPAHPFSCSAKTAEVVPESVSSKGRLRDKNAAPSTPDTATTFTVGNVAHLAFLPTTADTTLAQTDSCSIWSRPDPYRLVLDGSGEFSVVLYERPPSSVVQQNAFQILLHKYKNLPGSPPREIERHKVFWGLLNDGTCIYSNAPAGRGAPYVHGKLDPQKLGAVRERVRHLVETGRDPDLRYPWIVCTRSLATVHLQATVDGVAVSAEIPGPDFNSALVSRSGTIFSLNTAQENYRRRFAELVRFLNALRATSFKQLGPVPESARIRQIEVPVPKA